MAKELPRNPVEAVVFKAWEQVQPKGLPKTPFDLWHERLTPVFPDQWLPRASNTLSYYAYAYRLGQHLSDGEHQSAPWARIRVKGPNDAEPQLELLSKTIRESGIQGVRPLSKAEISIYKGGETLKAAILGMKTAPDRKLAARIKAYYCQWLRHNGRISSHIVPNHKPFVHWLACP